MGHTGTMRIGWGTLAEVLSQHLEAGTIQRKHIELAARVAHSTVARWVSGETVPTADQVSDMLAAGRLPSAVQRDMLDWLLTHSTFRIVRRVEAMGREELDVNHDGRVTGEDALRHVLAAQHRCVELAERIAGAVESGRIGEAELQAVRGMGQMVAAAIELAVEAARRDGSGQ